MTRVPILSLVILMGFSVDPAARADQEGTHSAAPPGAPPKEARKTFEAAAKAARNHRLGDARQDYKKAVELYSGYAEAWCELGKLQMAEGPPDAARRSFESAIAANPKYAMPYVELSALEYRARNWRALADITGRWIQLLSADYPQIYQFNAIANINLQNLEAAERSAREAERLDPGHKFPATWRVLGTILASRGDFAGAAEQLRQYLMSLPADPDNGETVRQLAELERRAGSLALPGAPTFRAEANLVLVRFQVSPQKGKLLAGLRDQDIELLEDGVPQEIALFEGGRFHPRTVPLEIALLFDCSGSVQLTGRLDTRVFQRSLLDEYANAKIAIYAFTDRLTRVIPPTRDGEALMKALTAVRAIPNGGTRLFGSIAEAAHDVAAAGGSAVRMLVIFSDGESTTHGDNVLDGEAIQAAQDHGIALYPVTLSNATFSESVEKFRLLARATGGMRFEAISNAGALPAILNKIAKRIQYDYVVGFYPPTSGGKTRHKVEVVLRNKDQGRILGGIRTVAH